MQVCNAHKKVMAFAFVALILICTFLPFLPHTHTDFSNSCMLCAMLDCGQSIYLGSIRICANAVIALLITFEISQHILYVRDGTPVGLKDKLSD